MVNKVFYNVIYQTNTVLPTYRKCGILAVFLIDTFTEVIKVTQS